MLGNKKSKNLGNNIGDINNYLAKKGQYKYIFIGLIAVLIISSITAPFYINYRKNQITTYSEKLALAIEKINKQELADAESDLKSIAKNAPSSVAAIANLNLAKIFISTNKIEKAQEHYQIVRDCLACNSITKEFATLLYYQLSVKTNSKEKNLLANLEKSAKESKVFSEELHLILAEVAIKNNNIELAKKSLNKIITTEDVNPVTKKQAEESLQKINS
jgi:hypothetical protein